MSRLTCQTPSRMRGIELPPPRGGFPRLFPPPTPGSRDVTTRDDAALANFELPRIDHGKSVFALVDDLPSLFATCHTKVARISYRKFDHLPSPSKRVCAKRPDARFKPHASARGLEQMVGLAHVAYQTITASTKAATATAASAKRPRKFKPPAQSAQYWRARGQSKAPYHLSAPDTAARSPHCLHAPARTVNSARRGT